MSMKPYKFSGLVHRVLPLQEFQSGFRKRTLVAVDDPNAKYPNYAAFDFSKDSVAILEDLPLGTKVEISFYPESRSWTDPKTNAEKWFSSFRGVKLERQNGGERTPSAPSIPVPDVQTITDDESEGLPF